ncbi:hypothetical protein BDZ91DRAFT_736591 [Kalaharituber pfeilii]|nr:hypothetical protein BDZ91DRAFT_736591 [Kalaharituber pfeilii]
MDHEREKYRFLELIFDESPIRRHGTWVKAHDSLQKYPDQLTTLTNNAQFLNTFIADFDRYGGRVVQFLQNAENYLPRTPEGLQSRKFLGNLMVDRLLVPLLDDQYYHLTDKETCFELLMSTLLLADHTGNRLRGLANRLSGIPGLLGKLISSDRSSDFLEDWVNALGRNHPDPSTLRGWTEVIANLSDTCVEGHDNIEEFLDKWNSLQVLRQQLHQSRISLTQNPHDHFSFPEEIQNLLRDLRLPTPNSELTLISAIKAVEVTFTFEILAALIRAMPCWVCFSKCAGGIHTLPAASHNRRRSSVKFDPTEADTIMYADLFGTSLGKWKITLSGQALKDLQQSQSEGNFDHIWSKLKDLATGDWVRRSVANPVSIDYLKFKVRLFEAKYGSNGRILWQVDRAFDERINAECQIVKVWRIGDVKEIKASYDLVARTQSTWSAQRIADCKRGDTTAEPDADNFENRTALDILVSGKFHTLTSKIFDNITSGNQDAEFPFDVTGTEIGIIKHFRTAAFILGRSGTGKTTCLLYKLLSRYLASAQNFGVEHRLRQILLTRSEPLSRKLRLELQRLIKSQLLLVDGVVFTREAPEDQENGDSKSLLSLQPEDFPLVCTFSHFMKLLENTIRAHDRQNFDFTERQGAGELVDFTIFKAAYWPKMGASKLDPGLVFSEIMGVIKGAGSSKNGFRPLSRDEYIARSPNLAPSFPSQSERELLYSIYENYERMKKQRRDHDSIDKVMSVLNAVSQPSMKRRLYDILQEIYVDEVQDQRAIEIELLLHLVQNPRGIHFAGDSAQCISNDSAFRFANVKALFYDHYFQFDPELAKPELFSLSKNFRSHQGILSLASFVMGLLWKGFPNMVDKLSPEIGQYQGPLPTIFIGPNITELLIMAGNENSSTDQQIIIVRDEETRGMLQSRLGDNSIVFTILQSKGMEYDDVYLYDFFSSSPCASAWRTLDVLLPEGSKPWYASQHMNLYVAITRPRSRLWLLESRPNPVIELLTTKLEKPLVNLRFFEQHNLESLMPELRPFTATTKEEWTRTGEQCMDQGIYDQALRCFQNSGDEEKIIWAKACIAEQKGREHRAKGQMREFSESFEQASKGFITIGMMPRAANCFEALGQYVKAAEIWSHMRQHQRAGELYEKAGASHIPRAADEYYMANLPAVALNLLLRGELYEKVVDGLTIYQTKIPESERKVMARQLNALLREGKIPKHLKQKTFNLLASEDEKKAFLKEFKLHEELWQFLEERDKLDEALEELVKANAMDLILKSSYKANKEWQRSRKADLAQIYNCVNANQVMSAFISNAETRIEVCPKQNYAGAVWAIEWTALVSRCEIQIKAGTLPSKRDLGEEGTWCVNFLSTILTLFPDYFLKRVDSLPQLSITIDYMCHMSAFVHSQQFPLATLSCLGLVNIAGQGYRPLPWSIMVTKRAAFERHAAVNQSEVYKHIVPNFESAAQKIYRKATELLSTLDTCIKCVGRESWALVKASDKRPKQPQCHQQQFRVNFRQRLRDLVKTCRIFGEIKQNYSSDWTTRCDSYCVTHLVRFLCYRSGYEQDAGVIAEVARKISTEKKYSMLLENLKAQSAISQTNTSKWTQNDLSSLLRNYRLRRTLEIKTPEGLPPQLNDDYKKDDLETPLQILKYYHNLQSITPGEGRGKLSTMIKTVRALIQSLEQFVNSYELKFYDPEIISIFEDIGTLLLFCGWRTEILVPRSWGIMYLPHWVTFLGRGTEEERNECRKALYHLVWMFCTMVTWLENQVQNVAQEVREVLARRSIDFLVVVLVNIGMMSPQPHKYKELFTEAQKVFAYKTSLKTGSIHTVPCQHLLKPLIDAFTFYNGKDHLCMYTCMARPGLPVSAHMTWLRTVGIEIKSRPNCNLKHMGCDTVSKVTTTAGLCMYLLRWNAANLIQKAYRNHLRRTAAKRAKAASLILKAYRTFQRRRAMQRAKAATVILKAYRRFQQRKAERRAQSVIWRVWLRYKRDREYLRSPECNAIRKIQETFQKKRLQKPKLTKKDYFKLIAVMLSDGIQLFIELEALHNKYRTVFARANNTTNRNKLGKLLPKIVNLKETLFQSSPKFAALDLSDEVLRQRISDGMATVKGIKQELEKIDESIKGFGESAAKAQAGKQAKGPGNAGKGTKADGSAKQAKGSGNAGKGTKADGSAAKTKAGNQASGSGSTGKDTKADDASPKTKPGNQASGSSNATKGTKVDDSQAKGNQASGSGNPGKAVGKKSRKKGGNKKKR